MTDALAAVGLTIVTSPVKTTMKATGTTISSVKTIGLKMTPQSSTKFST